MRIRLVHTLFGLLTGAAVAHAGPVFNGFLNDPANVALRASDLSAPLFASDLEIVNNVALYDLTITVAGPARFLSTGFAAGGVDPYFTLFAGSGSGATFLGSNFAQAFSTGGDFDLTYPLAIGVYTVAIGAFANLSFAENFGAGTLGDGFTGLGVPEFLGTTFYELEVLEGSFEVPEPSYVWFAGLLCVALFWRRWAENTEGLIGESNESKGYAARNSSDFRRRGDIHEPAPTARAGPRGIGEGCG